VKIKKAAREGCFFFGSMYVFDFILFGNFTIYSFDNSIDAFSYKGNKREYY
jgi:hypothetical protein